MLIKVLVKSLYDRGFLFLLSSSQMAESKGTEKALVIFSCRLNTYPLPWAKFSLLNKKGKKTHLKLAVCFFRAVGAVGEEPASIIHLPGVKDGC